MNAKPNNLNEIIARKLAPNQNFTSGDESLKFTLTDFWQWALSDLVENRNRGILAEFIVMKALGIKEATRLEWNNYDLKTTEGITIEVKSAAYFQTWKQSKPSSIVFNIAPTKAILENNHFAKEAKRQADIYIFCLLNITEIDKEIKPMNLDQWLFYLVQTKELNKRLKNQKTLSLSTLKTLNYIECSYNNLKESFKQINEL